MTVIEKVKNLVNPKKWMQGFMLNKFAKRVAQFGSAALIGLLSTPKIADALGQYGVSLNMDKEVLANGIAIALAGLLGGLFNTAKHGPLKTEGDVPSAPPAKP